MPNLKDSPVLVLGQILDLSPIMNRDTQKREGTKVMIMAGDGFAVVKLTIEDQATHNVVAELGRRVAWFIRNTPYSVEGNSGMSTRFVRLPNEDDLDMFVSTAGDLVGAPASK